MQLAWRRQHCFSTAAHGRPEAAPCDVAQQDGTGQLRQPVQVLQPPAGLRGLRATCLECSRRGPGGGGASMSSSRSKRSTLLAFWGGRGRASGCASCVTMLPSVGWCSTPTGLWLSCCRTWVTWFLGILAGDSAAAAVKHCKQMKPLLLLHRYILAKEVRQSHSVSLCHQRLCYCSSLSCISPAPHRELGQLCMRHGSG